MKVKTWDKFNNGKLTKLGAITSPYSLRKVMGGEIVEAQLDIVVSPSSKVNVEVTKPEGVPTDTSDGVE